MDAAIAAGSDTVSDVPIAFGDKFAGRLVALGKAKTLGQKLSVFKGFGPGELAPKPPSINEPRTLMSMGQHCEQMAKTWQISREAQDELALASHLNAAKAWQDGFFDDLVVPCEGVVRDNNIRADSSMESLAGLRAAYDKTGSGTLTAGSRILISTRFTRRLQRRCCVLWRPGRMRSTVNKSWTVVGHWGVLIAQK